MAEQQLELDLGDLVSPVLFVSSSQKAGNLQETCSASLAFRRTVTCNIASLDVTKTNADPILSKK